MTDEFTSPTQPTVDEPAGHRSFMMALSALVTLLVAAWCLAGGPFFVQAEGLPWALLAVGIVVGVGLIASGFRRK